ncbi:hypothetical protein [Methylophaga sp.]|uniref:hypothetical protein n=1 Tax=Methylophaga sp. TaxID=2024840 RepID=UPI003A9370DB
MDKFDDTPKSEDVSSGANDAIRNLEHVRLWANAYGLKLDSNLSYIISQIKRYREQNGPSRPAMTSAAYNRPNSHKISKETPSADPRVPFPKKKKKPKKKKGPSIDLEKPARKLKGAVQCEQCRKTRYETWKYSKTDGTFKTLCRYCRQALLDQKHGKKDALDRAVSGGAYGSNRRKF